MVKNRNILILAAVLLVLLAVSLAQRAGHRKNTSRSSSEKIVAGTITADQLDRITVGRGPDEEAVVLVAAPTGWVTATAWDAPASTQRIDALLAAVSDLGGEFRSDSESVLGDYGLSADQAVKVRAYGKDGTQVLALDIGNKPEGSPGNFIKLPGSNRVLLTASSLLSQLGLYSGPGLPKSQHFLDLQAFQADRLAVDRIILDDEGRVLELAKDFPEPKPTVGLPTDEDAAADAEPAEPARTTWEWQLTAPQVMALAKTKADGVLNALVGIRALDVDDPGADRASWGLEPPVRQATLLMEDGSETTLAFGNQREAEGDLQAGYRMTVQGQPTVWVVSEYTVDNIFKSQEDLLPEK
jgi:hypothetical protein